jgi:hypothetical protein
LNSFLRAKCSLLHLWAAREEGIRLENRSD